MSLLSVFWCLPVCGAQDGELARLGGYDSSYEKDQQQEINSEIL
eukprot:COSAG02_NODE_63063_length_264_cov_0.630303_1_plen_43_part_01